MRFVGQWRQLVESDSHIAKIPASGDGHGNRRNASDGYDYDSARRHVLEPICAFRKDENVCAQLSKHQGRSCRSNT